MRAVLATVASAFLLALGPAGVAAAAQWTDAMAPEYESSEPSDGATMHQPPDEVRVTFSEPLDPSSTLTVEDECGEAVDDGSVEVIGTDMSVGLARTPQGVYRVSYRAVGLGGVTGETEGGFDFTVHAGTPCGESGHGGHGGHGGGGGGGEGGEHEGHGGSGGGHEGGHEGNGHETAPGSHDSMDHATMGGTHGDGHRKNGKRGKHAHHDMNHQRGRNRPEPQADPEPPPVAAGADAPIEPNSQAVTAALMMSLGFGVLGGWYLRTSARR